MIVCQPICYGLLGITLINIPIGVVRAISAYRGKEKYNKFLRTTIYSESEGYKKLGFFTPSRYHDQKKYDKYKKMFEFYWRFAIPIVGPLIAMHFDHKQE